MATTTLDLCERLLAIRPERVSSPGSGQPLSAIPEREWVELQKLARAYQLYQQRKNSRYTELSEFLKPGK